MNYDTKLIMERLDKIESGIREIQLTLKNETKSDIKTLTNRVDGLERELQNVKGNIKI